MLLMISHIPFSSFSAVFISAVLSFSLFVVPPHPPLFLNKSIVMVLFCFIVLHLICHSWNAEVLMASYKLTDSQLTVTSSVPVCGRNKTPWNTKCDNCHISCYGYNSLLVCNVVLCEICIIFRNLYISVCFRLLLYAVASDSLCSVVDLIVSG